MVAPPVYPRWRGEHFDASILSKLGTGLSPLARGTPRHQRETHRYHRFIPAGAGNTSVVSVQRSSSTVYPRWRGEHARPASPQIANGGLSPLARGTQQRRFAQKQQTRFIPAGAGNTSASEKKHSEKSVYPRWRGEHDRLWPRGPIHPGLSPLARGTPEKLPAGERLQRFIPAGAGNTLNVYNCFLLHFLPRNDPPTYQQQIQFIKEHSTY